MSQVQSGSTWSLRAAAVLACGGLALAAAPAASAATSGLSRVSSPTYQTNGKVSAILTVGSTTYLAGSFTSLRPAGAPVGAGSSVARSYLAAVDSSTGALLPWAPAADKPVNSLALSPDGRTVYAGGAFTKIDGQWRRHAAGLGAASGAVTEFKADTLGDVSTVLAAGDRVYLGGAFTRVNGVDRSRLAAVTPSGALVADWVPSADAVVRTMALSADGAALWVGGEFGTVNGDATQKRLAKLSVATAAAQPLKGRPAYPLWSIVVTPDRVLVGGDGSGGHIGSFRPDGTRGWTRQIDGSVQGMAVLNGVLYVGGHFATICVGDNPGGTTSGGFQCGTVEAKRGKVLALDAATGTLDAWNPGANSPLGVFALDATGGTLRVGGTFTVLGGRQQQGYGSFSS